MKYTDWIPMTPEELIEAVERLEAEIASNEVDKEERD